jgi:hypothetical protein
VSSGVDLILDDNGRVWRTGSRALMESLHVVRPVLDLTHYLVRNLGFVRLQTTRSGVRITLHPRFLTREAYEALVFQMIALELDRFIVQIVDGPGRVEIIPGVEDAAARLADLASVGGNITRQDFYREELSLHRLRDNPRLSPLADLLRRWRRRQGIIRRDLAAEFGDPVLRGRVVVKRIVDETGGVYEYVGDGFPSYDATWREAMLGRDATAQPDAQYARHTATAQLETDVAETPRLETVDAVIRVPGCPVYRRRYERLLLPWRRGDARFVSVASVLRTSFAIPSDT